jgi:ligand-binding sensor domain-containing protein
VSKLPFTVVLFCCWCLEAAGQRPQTFGFDHLTVDEGLSHNTVYSILQDRSGLVWIGTRYGLNRYDGYRCEVFLPESDPAGALQGFTVLAMHEDRQGRIWIGHRGAGISVLDRYAGTFRRFPEEADGPIDWKTITVRAFFEDSRGWLWVGIAGAGAVVFDRDGRKIAHLWSRAPAEPRLRNDFVFDFLEDRQGRIWIAADGPGIQVYDPAARTVSVKNSRDGRNLDSYEKSLCRDRQGNLWIGTAGSGLYRYEPGPDRFTHFFHRENQPGQLSHNIVTDLACDSAGILWIATDGGGLNILDPATGRFQVVRAAPASYRRSLNTDALYQVLFDAAGNLWVGTFNGGVNILPAYSPPFQIHENQTGYERQGLRSVLALHDDPGGRIWMGTDGAGLFTLEAANAGLEVRPDRRFPHNVVTCLAPAGPDRLWIGTYADGLTLFDTRTGAIRNFRHQAGTAHSLSHNNVWDIEPDLAGGLWIGTLGGGLDYFLPEKNTFVHYAPQPGNAGSLSSVQIVDVLLDRDRRQVWAASEDNGLNRLDLATGKFDRYGLPALSSNNLRCLFQDRHGALWIGTEFNGLDRLDPATGLVRHFDTRHGLPSNIINSIEEDARGFLWISTHTGIARWNPADQTFIDFGGDPDLRNNQYNPKASLILPDGRLVFGGTNGFSVLLPEKIRPNPRPPQVVFTDLKLLGQSVRAGEWNGRQVLNGNLNDPGTVVRLSHADRGIVFEFTGADYATTAKLRYSYRLEGFDDRWNYVCAGEHRAIFSNLKGGAYRLQVRASNSDNVWSGEKTLNVVVRPPFWETWWFIAACTLAGLLLATLILRFLLKRQKARFEEAALKAEQEILRLKNENLEKEVEAKQARLSASALQTAHKNKFLNDLKASIERIDHTDRDSEAAELRRVIRAINHELNQKDYWDEFQLTFNQTHQDFIHELRSRHPAMSGNDLRLCCFIRLEMNNPEIAAVLHITVNAVEQTKYRLKKKIGLEPETSLNEYIRGI